MLMLFCLYLEISLLFSITQRFYNIYGSLLVRVAESESQGVGGFWVGSGSGS